VNDTIRVMIVDDESAVRNSLVRFMDDEGFAVTALATIAEARSAAQTIAFDIVIADLRLLDGDGESMIAALAVIDPRLKFLIYTGSREYRLSAPMRRCGVGPSDIFFKPLPQLAVLAQAVRRRVGAARHEVTHA
jgi:sigma-B regulation protein RsbU (phosphoserine phosphatase)